MVQAQTEYNIRCHADSVYQQTANPPSVSDDHDLRYAIASRVLDSLTQPVARARDDVAEGFTTQC